MKMYKMFIADDEVVILRGLKKILDWKELNIEIIDEATNGNDAEKIILEKKPDLAILDICMPGKTGLEILKEVSKRNIKTRIIFLSGYEEFSYVQEALKYGAVHYLLKPVNTKELTDAVSEATFQISKEKEVNIALEKLSEIENKKSYINLSEVNKEYSYYTALAIGIKDAENYESEMLRLVLFSIFNTIENYINFRNLGIAFTKDSEIFVILNHETKDNYPIKISKELIEEIKRSSSNMLIIGVGVTNKGISEIKKSITTARDALKYRFFMEESDVLVYNSRRKDNTKHEDNNIEQVLEYIARHYFENITLDSVAQKVHMNAYYLSSYFKKHTGMNFKDYLTKIRMSEALELLKEENFKTYELAERVGFSDPRYFSELFKKYYGKTPMEFKSKGKSKK